jgi:RimJ/RimL family protein N-acetyltransferase
MRHVLEFDLDKVLPFMHTHIPGFVQTEGMRAIGLRRNGELVSGSIYEGFNGHNVWVHLASIPGGHWLNRMYLRAAFTYVFVQLGCSRLSGYVNASNVEACRFDEHIGFKEEARLKGAAPDGGDVILYVMWRGDCRYVDTQ